MQTSEQFLSTKEAAKLLGISSVAVFKRIKAGSLSATKVGRNYVILKSALNLKKVGWKNSLPISSKAKIPHKEKKFISLADPKEIALTHDELFTTTIDLKGRDLIVGFNEPAFKSSYKNGPKDLDAKLNARLLSYFLPAIQIAEMQKERPRLVIVSGINAAFKWNAENDRERKIMAANNDLKINFIQRAIQYFFPDTFSVVQSRASYDFLKINDRKLDLIWNIFERRYPEEIQKLKGNLLRYRNPKIYTEILTEKDINTVLKMNELDLKLAFRYAVSHLFALGDVNLSYDFIHNEKGYCSVGEHHEAVFNVIRKIGYEILKDIGEAVFDQEVYCFENPKVVVKDGTNAPPPYNGAFRSVGDKTYIDEVTYENSLSLAYYDKRPRLKPTMEYLYHIIPKVDYEKFWKMYKQEYMEQKCKLREAYKIENW